MPVWLLSTRECDVMSTMAKNQSDQMSTQTHFRSGVNMGIGSFNLVRALVFSASALWVR